MKHFIFSFLLIIGTAASAQTLWTSNAEEAFAQAHEKDLPLMMVFSGSDWCKPCIQLTREVFESDVFKEYAADEFILLRVDFPRARKNRLSPDLQQQNNALAERWNPHGEFPLVVVFSSDREVIFTTGYLAGGPEAYVQYLTEELSHHESNH